MNIEPEAFTLERYLYRLYSESDRFNEMTMRASPLMARIALGGAYEITGISEMHTTAAIEKCECGSGSNERSGAHSHWCQLWLAP